MPFTNLKVHTNPWYPDPANPTARDVSAAVDAATHAHFRVPPLREMILRYLLTPSSTNQQLTLASHPAAAATMTSARTRFQPTTLEDRFQLPLQDGALSPADAALLARVAPAAVSAPRRHAFSRATTTSAGMFSPSHVKTETARGSRAAAAAGAAQEQKCFGRCPSPRHCSIASPPPTPAEGSSVGSGAAMAWARLGPPFVMPAEGTVYLGDRDRRRARGRDDRRGTVVVARVWTRMPGLFGLVWGHPNNRSGKKLIVSVWFGGYVGDTMYSIVMRLCWARACVVRGLIRVHRVWKKMYHRSHRSHRSSA
jgi:hypothetical protein